MNGAYLALVDISNKTDKKLVVFFSAQEFEQGIHIRAILLQ